MFESYAPSFGLMGTFDYLLRKLPMLNDVIYQKLRDYKFSELAELKISETRLKYATFL